MSGFEEHELTPRLTLTWAPRYLTWGLGIRRGTRFWRIQVGHCLLHVARLPLEVRR